MFWVRDIIDKEEARNLKGEGLRLLVATEKRQKLLKEAKKIGQKVFLFFVVLFLPQKQNLKERGHSILLPPLFNHD